MKRSGVADLPLHGGRVPQWLADRMSKLGTAIVESIGAESHPCEECNEGNAMEHVGILEITRGAKDRPFYPVSHTGGVLRL